MLEIGQKQDKLSPPNLATTYILLELARGNWPLEINCDTFVTIRQPPLIFVRFTLNFLRMCSDSVVNAHVNLE